MVKNYHQKTMEKKHEVKTFISKDLRTSPTNYDKLVKITDAKISNENIVCEALECFERATGTIELSAGHYGGFTLNLCSECVNKFIGDDKDE